MHNLDRTNPEWGETMESFEAFEQGENETFETGSSGEMFELNEMHGESPFNETQEMELAAELLEITNEEELNYFLGNLIKRAAGAVGKIVKSPIGRTLGGVLRNVAKTALPMAGAALGNLVLPGVGGMIGGKLASTAGSMFGLELNGGWGFVLPSPQCRSVSLFLLCHPARARIIRWVHVRQFERSHRVNLNDPCGLRQHVVPHVGR